MAHIGPSVWLSKKCSSWPISGSVVILQLHDSVPRSLWPRFPPNLQTWMSTGQILVTPNLTNLPHSILSPVVFFLLHFLSMNGIPIQQFIHIRNVGDSLTLLYSDIQSISKVLSMLSPMLSSWIHSPLQPLLWLHLTHNIDLKKV